MGEYGHGCLVCGRPITYQFAICSECEGVHGRTSSEWPRWLAFLWSETVKERRRYNTILKREVTSADLTFAQQVAYDDTWEEQVV
jgi:hypothetical protein